MTYMLYPCERLAYTLRSASLERTLPVVISSEHMKDKRPVRLSFQISHQDTSQRGRGKLTWSPRSTRDSLWLPPKPWSAQLLGKDFGREQPTRSRMVIAHGGADLAVGLKSSGRSDHLDSGRLERICGRVCEDPSRRVGSLKARRTV